MKSKNVAAILALFLGGLGVHKFYLGQGFQGLLYFLFSWTFIPAFIGLLEAIVYLSTDEQSFQQKYGNQRQLAAGAGAGSQSAQNVTVNLTGAGQGGNGGLSVSDELLKLSQLRTAGVLSEGEFQAQKMRLLR